MKWLLLAFLTLIAIAGLACYLYAGHPGSVILSRHASIEVNGSLVPGELLLGRYMAILTRRDRGKEHSYILGFAGDFDSTGNMGNVIDCHQWVAPHVPILPVTDGYPNCKFLPSDKRERCGWGLMHRAGGAEFTTKDGTKIGLRW